MADGWETISSDGWTSLSSDGWENVEKPKGSTSLWEDIKIPLASAANTLDTGVTLAGRGLESIVGKDRSIEDEDALFNEMKRRREQREKWANPNDSQQSFAAKVGGMVATLPAQMVGMAGASAERGMNMVDAGESTNAAKIATLADTALNVGSLALPAGFGATRTSKVLTGAGANVATGAASDAITQAVSSTDTIKKMYDPMNLENRAMEALLGAGFGFIAKPPPKGKGDTKGITDNLDAIDRAKKAAAEEIVRTQKLAQGKQGELGFEGPATSIEQIAARRRDPNQGDLLLDEGQMKPVEGTDVVRPELTDAQKTLEAQMNDPKAIGKGIDVTEPVSRANDYSDTSKSGTAFTAKDVRTQQLSDKTVTTPESVLQHLATRYKANDPMSMIVAKLQELVSTFEGKHGLWIELADDATVLAPGTGKKYPGFFDGIRNHIVLGKEAQNGGVAVHEIVHGITHRFIETQPNHPSVKLLQALYDQIKNDPILKQRDQYGLTDLHEFTAESFGSASFRNRLAQIPTTISGKVSNALVDFINILKGLLKAPDTPETTSVLAKLLEATEGITKAYQADKFNVDRKYNDLASKNQLPVQVRLAAELVAQKNENVVSAISKITDEASQKQAVMDNIPGMEGVDYVPKDPVITPELVAKIAGEKDGSSVWGLTPGALARSLLADSTLVKTVYRLLTNARNRAEFYASNVVKPVEELMNPILRSDKLSEVAHNLFMRELKNKTEYTVKELQEAGVPEQVVTAHMAMRDMFRKTIDAQNEARLSKGLEPIKPIDAYMSARWQGPWRTLIKDADGKIVWAIAETSKRKADAAVAHVLKSDPTLKAKDVAYRKGRDKGDTLNAGYLEMLQLLDPSDPRTAALDSIYKDYILGNTENVAGQEKHFKRKTGVRGYAGDRPWDKGDAKEMFLQQFQYAKNAYSWAEMQKPMEAVKNLLKEPSLQESQKNNIAFSQEYTKNTLGFGINKTFDALENGLAKGLGLSPGHLDTVLGELKGFFYITKLGLSLPFMAVQIIQPVLVAPARHAKLTAMGYDHNPVMTMIGGMTDGLIFSLYHSKLAKTAGEGRSKAYEKLSPLGQEAANYAETNGVVDVNQFSDIKNLRKSGPRLKIEAPFNWSITAPEAVARSQAFMSYVHHLAQSGKFDLKSHDGRLQLFQLAEEATKISMTDYNPQERALVFERLGLTGNALSTLRTFQINQMAQLIEYGKDARKGNVAPLFYYLAAYGMAGGLGGMFFMEDIDDMLGALKGALPHSAYMKVKDFSIKQFMLDNLGELATTGLVAKTTGTNINTRLSSSNQLPFYPFEQDSMATLNALFPFAGDAFKQAAGLYDVMNPNSTPKERAIGMYAITPTGFRGVMDELNPAFKSGDTSLSVGSKLERGVYRRTPEEQYTRLTGLKSYNEAMASDKDFRLYKIEREMGDRAKSQVKKALEYYSGGNAIAGTEALVKVFELGGNPQAVINQIPQYQINQVTTELERRAIGASGGSSVAAQRLLRYMQLGGQQVNPQEAPSQAPQSIPTPSSQLGTPAPQSAAPRASTQSIVSTEELKLLPYHHPKLDKVAFETEKKYKLPTGLLVAIKNAGEKSNSDQESPKGAKGVMQFIDSTREAYPHDPKDPMQSIDASGRYFKDLLKMYRGNVRAVVAHYNGGRKAGLAVLDGEQPPADETRAYLVRVEKHMKDARNGR